MISIGENPMVNGMHSNQWFQTHFGRFGSRQSHPGWPIYFDWHAILFATVDLIDLLVNGAISLLLLSWSRLDWLRMSRIDWELLDSLSPLICDSLLQLLLFSFNLRVLKSAICCGMAWIWSCLSQMFCRPGILWRHTNFRGLKSWGAGLRCGEARLALRIG